MEPTANKQKLTEAEREQKIKDGKGHYAVKAALVEEESEKRKKKAQELCDVAPELFTLREVKRDEEVKIDWQGELLWSRSYPVCNYRVVFDLLGTEVEIEIAHHIVMPDGAWHSHDRGIEYKIRKSKISDDYGDFWYKNPKTMLKKVREAIKIAKVHAEKDDETKRIYDSLLEQVEKLLPYALSIEYWEEQLKDRLYRPAGKLKFIKAEMTLGAVYYGYVPGPDGPVAVLHHTEPNEAGTKRMNKMIMEYPYT